MRKGGIGGLTRLLTTAWKPSTPHVTKLGFPKLTRTTGVFDLEVTQDPKVSGRHPAGISGHLGIWLVLPIQVTVELEQNVK